MIEALLAIVLLLTIFAVFLLIRFSSKLERISVDQETVRGAIATCWKELGIDQDIGAIKQRAEDIQKATQNLENLFKITRGRAEYGEFQLEHILKDILPSKYIHIRQRLPKIGKIPDAHITSPRGIICIDSKFPLENYRKMIETKDDNKSKFYAQKFREDVRGHIEKIKTDYVKPEEGTTNFAFGFIPSEAVYQYLTECEMPLVADAAKEGVLLVSPATLAVNLNLLAVSLQAMEISEKTEQIQKNLGKFSISIRELEEAWNILYGHIKNTYTKAGDVDQKQARLRDTFQQITQIEEQSKS
ncbi:MAG: DNA recombination protein RmuC [Candidatus Methanomethyliales bacterium]|nr:DNA recombination protein RmuC [Candidatus Methanomethylicales archaeon]